jgi:hypothetical protein
MITSSIYMMSARTLLLTVLLPDVHGTHEGLLHLL